MNVGNWNIKSVAQELCSWIDNRKVRDRSSGVQLVYNGNQSQYGVVHDCTWYHKKLRRQRWMITFLCISGVDIWTTRQIGQRPENVLVLGKEACMWSCLGLFLAWGTPQGATGLGRNLPPIAVFLGVCSSALHDPCGWLMTSGGTGGGWLFTTMLSSLCLAVVTPEFVFPAINHVLLCCWDHPEGKGEEVGLESSWKQLIQVDGVSD